MNEQIITTDNIIELFHEKLGKIYDDIFRASLQVNAVFVDLELEKIRRFKSFIKEEVRSFFTSQNFNEKVYYNDGSPEGLLLFTLSFTQINDTGDEISPEMIFVIYKDNKKFKEHIFK